MAAADGGDPRVIDRWDGGLGWLASPNELMRRASHALATDDGVWVVDPVDAPGVDDHLADLGPVHGVVVLLDRHTRDAAVLARRHDVAVHVPSWLRGSISGMDAPVRSFDGELGETGYRARRVVALPFWREAALWGHGTLVTADALGTASYFVAPGERLGVHPLLRVMPPRHALGDLRPDRVLVGHGEGVCTDATAALRTALGGARRRAPRLYASTLRRFLTG